MLHTVELGEYMLKWPITVTPHMTVYEAAHHILDNKISGVLVVDKNNHLVGMLSELDCLKAILSSVYNDEEFGVAIVSDIMTCDVECQNPHDDIIDVALSMIEHKHRRRPVVLDGKIIGQVTCRQILKVIGETGLKARPKGNH